MTRRDIKPELDVIQGLLDKIKKVNFVLFAIFSRGVFKFQGF